MHVTLAGWALAGAAMFAAAARLYRCRCARRQRRWELRWQSFLASQPGLDRELELLWHLLEY